MADASLSDDKGAERTLVRFGAFCLLAGAIIFMVANIIHPRSPNIEYTPAQVETVAQSSIWLTDHLLLLLGGLLLLPGFMAMKHLLSSGKSAPWAQLGYAGALVSTSIWAVLMALDGITSKVVHSAWADAALQDKAVALQIAEMMEQIDIGLFSVYIVVFFGITFFFYGLATTKSDIFPHWLGWVAVALSTASFAVGIIQSYTGLSVLITNRLFASFSSALVLWMIILGILAWRKTT